MMLQVAFHDCEAGALIHYRMDDVQLAATTGEDESTTSCAT